MTDTDEASDARATTVPGGSARPAVPPVPAAPRRVGVMLPRDLPVAQVLPFVRRAEELGFEELWVVEDLGFRGGIAQAGAVLAATERITVGLGILPTGARNVAFAAMELATLAHLFPGRLVAGIGHGMPGWMRDVDAWPASPVTLLTEYTTALRALLRGERVATQGRYVTLHDVQIGEVPDVAPPVVLGVRGPRSMAVAGRVADGVLLAEPSPPTYVAAAIEQLGGPVGPDGVRREVMAYDVAAVADEPEAAYAVVRPALAWIGEPDWAPHVARLPFAAELTALRERTGSPQAFGAALPSEWLADLALAGTPDQVRAGVAARHDAGATSVVLTPVGDDRLGALETFARVLGT